jgi:hypothetical protein
MVLDPCSLNAGVEIVAHLALVVTVKLATQEGYKKVAPIVAWFS